MARRFQTLPAIIYPDDDPNVERELHDLRRFLPETPQSSLEGVQQSFTMQRLMRQAPFSRKTSPNFRSSSLRSDQPGHENERGSWPVANKAEDDGQIGAALRE